MEIPEYEYEGGGGGGGGGARGTGSVDYQIEFKLARRLQVGVDVIVRLKNIADDEWVQRTGLPEAAIKNITATSSGQEDALTTVFDRSAGPGALIIREKKGTPLRAFQLHYDVDCSQFFDSFNPVNSKSYSFDYFDVIWCSYDADQFSVTVDFPSPLTINKVSPAPFILERDGKLKWQRSHFPQKTELRLNIEGEVQIVSR